jgi:hypothetical protein
VCNIKFDVINKSREHDGQTGRGRVRIEAVIVASSEKHPFQTFQWFQPFHRFALFKGCACSKFKVQCLTAVQGSKVQEFKERKASTGALQVFDNFRNVEMRTVSLPI